MNRYDNIKKRLSKDRSRVYRTTFYPVIQEHSNDIYITARAGDSLSQFAHKYYNDKDLWWVIAKANNIGKGSVMIEPGLRIRIPSQINEILSEYDRENS